MKKNPFFLLKDKKSEGQRVPPTEHTLCFLSMDAFPINRMTIDFTILLVVFILPLGMIKNTLYLLSLIHMHTKR